jgi:hypothetical protein
LFHSIKIEGILKYGGVAYLALTLINLLFYSYLLIFKVLFVQGETVWGYYEAIIKILLKSGIDLLWGGFFISLGLFISLLRGDKKIGNK